MAGPNSGALNQLISIRTFLSGSKFPGSRKFQQTEGELRPWPGPLCDLINSIIVLLEYSNKGPDVHEYE